VAIVWGWVLVTGMNLMVGLALSEMASGEAPDAAADHIRPLVLGGRWEV
jgi:hypothetical protein